MAIRPRTCHLGFTLVEAMVVIGVIGLIIGLVMPVLGSLRAESKSTLCLSNLRQLFTAVETARQQRKTILPYAAPLPAPTPGPIAQMNQSLDQPGLPEQLRAIVQQNSTAWFCPADESDDAQAIGTSYQYVPGWFMVAEPPLVIMNSQTGMQETEQEPARRVRAARLITQRYTNDYLWGFPVLADMDSFHQSGNREPWNGVFMDGSARVGRPGDSDIQPPPP